MSKAGMIRRCAIEIRVWQYFRWIFLAYGLVCLATGSLTYSRACRGSTTLMRTLLPPGSRGSKPPPIGKAADSVLPAEALQMEMQAANAQLVYAVKHQYEQVEERAMLAVLAGLGVILFTLYRWKGSLAARIALELRDEQADVSSNA